MAAVGEPNKVFIYDADLEPIFSPMTNGYAT